LNYLAFDLYLNLTHCPASFTLFLEFIVYFCAQALFGELAVLGAGIDIVEDRLPAGRAIHLHIDGKQLYFTAAARAFLNLYGGCAAAERTGTFILSNHAPIVGMKRLRCYDLCHTMPAGMHLLSADHVPVLLMLI
jgi:hypothetical protein